MKNHHAKFVLLAAILLNAAATSAQSEFDYKKAFAEADTFIQQFVDYSDFREPLKDNVTSVSRDQFKGMFKPGVFILDLYNPERDAKAQSMPILPITPRIRTIDDFAEDVSSYCRNGASIKITGINADYSKIETGTFKLQVRMESMIRDFQEWKYTVYQEMTLRAEWDAGASRYLIAALDVADNYIVKCSNCVDRFAGKVDPADDPKQPVKVWASLNGIGGVSMITVANPQISQLNSSVYSNLIASQSSLGKLSATGMKPCWGLEGMAQVMKGYTHQWGVSAGVGVFSMQAKFNQEPSTLVYKAVDAIDNAYNRRVQLEQSVIDANLFTAYAPVYVNYTRRVNKKLKLHASLGTMVTFWGVMNSTQSSRADYEAMLKFGEVNGNAVNTVFSEDGSADVVLDETTLTEEQRSNLSALGNYDLAFNRELQGSTKMNATLGVAVTAKVGAGWMVNSSTEAIVSLGAISGSQKWEVAPVTLTNRSSDVQAMGSTLAGIGEWQSIQPMITAGVRFYLSSFKK